MRKLWRDVKEHRMAVMLFLFYWVVTWGVTGATWLFDSSGHSVGMAQAALYMHMSLPLLAGMLVGWWRSVVLPRKVRLVPSAWGGAFAGFLVGEIDLVVLLFWSASLALLGRTAPVASGQPAWVGSLEVLEFIVLLAVGGLFFGMVGGLSSGMLSDQVHRWRGQIKPPHQ